MGDLAAPLIGSPATLQTKVTRDDMGIILGLSLFGRQVGDDVGQREIGSRLWSAKLHGPPDVSSSGPRFFVSGGQENPDRGSSAGRDRGRCVQMAGLWPPLTGPLI